MLYLVLLENLIVNWQHSPAGIAKHHLYALIFQGLNYHFCSGHLVGHVFAPN